MSEFIKKDDLSKLEEQGLVQAFEYNHELAWKTLKDILTYQGINILGSRDAAREAFCLGLLGDNEKDGQIWMDMILSRNLTAHTYNEQVTKK